MNRLTERDLRSSLINASRSEASNMAAPRELDGLTWDDLGSLFTARRVGAAGRNGNTVGTYICADFACSANARTLKASPTLTPDPGKPVDQRLRELGERVDGFIDEVRRI